MSEKHVVIASKMYAARSTVIEAIGLEAFKKRVAEYRPILINLAKSYDDDLLRATMSVLGTMQTKGIDGMYQLMALAACVEIIEPYKDSNGN